jgi:leucyl-tRNA synthetase
MHSRDELDMGLLMSTAMADPDVQANPKGVPPFAQQLVKEIPRTAPDILDRIAALPDETEFLRENRDFIQRSVGCQVEIVPADAPDLDDPGNKARHAVPGRVAIYVE